MKRVFGMIVLVGVVLVVALPAFGANDPGFAKQWALARIQAEPAWGGSTGAGVVVAVVDTGVDFGHEDLSGSSAGSFDCTGNPCGPGGADGSGHGTAVAGVIAAGANNGRGISPVAPNARIMSVKALGDDGGGSLSAVVRGITFAADNGAKVINLSLAGQEIGVVFDLLNQLLGGQSQAAQKQAFQAAIDHASARGALVVAAAGNDGLNTFYAGLHGVYVVGATGPEDNLAPYSSSGFEILAPGGASSGGCSPERCVLTTIPGGYGAVQGTSFAAPHVSGVAAMVIEKGFGGSAAIARINETADAIGPGRRVNALKAAGGPSDVLGAEQATSGLEPGGASAAGKSKVKVPVPRALKPLLPVDAITVPVLVLGPVDTESKPGPRLASEAAEGRAGDRAKSSSAPNDPASKSLALTATLLAVTVLSAGSLLIVRRRAA